MSDSIVSGLFGTGSFVSGQTDNSYRRAMARLYPNGRMKITGLTSLMRKEKIESVTHEWWTKSFPTRSGSLTAGNILDGVGGSTVDSRSLSKGNSAYVYGSTSTLQHFRAGSNAILRQIGSGGDCDNRLMVKVTANNTTYLTCVLLEDDDNGTGANGTAELNFIEVAGNLNPQGGTTPASQTYQPTKLTNKTTISRNSILTTRTAMQSKQRVTPDQWQEARRELVENHGADMEQKLLWGTLYEGINVVNGQPETDMMGIVEMIHTHAADRVFDFSDPLRTFNADYVGDKFNDSGLFWFLDAMELLGRTGDTNRLAVCGSQALLHLNRAILKFPGTTIEHSTGTTSWGMDYSHIRTPFLNLTLTTHPLLSQSAGSRDMMIVLDPKNMKYMYLQDTIRATRGWENRVAPDTFGASQDSNGFDGKEEELLTEFSWQYDHPETFGIFYNIGRDSVSA